MKPPNNKPPGAAAGGLGMKYGEFLLHRVWDCKRELGVSLDKKSLFGVNNHNFFGKAGLSAFPRKNYRSGNEIAGGIHLTEAQERGYVS